MSKITLVSASDVGLDKLVASDANMRRIKAGVSVEDPAEDIARRGLLQSLSVRPLVDGDGAETGKYRVTARGRRLAALKLLVKQKRLAKNAPVPCIVKTDGVEEEDSLAENTMREALHPLDQFRAFRNLHEQGLNIDDIAARFFVSAQIVRQRLKLAAASPKLLDLYVAEELSLDQLMAFCVTDDHACRLALQGGTGLSLKFNGLAETEVPFLAFQSRLAHALWALKMVFVDRSIDRGIFDRNVNFAQGNSPTALPFQSRVRAPESHMEWVCLILCGW